MREERDYDLVVIGSGPAGEKGAAQIAYFGKKVAMVEKEKVFGGAAANTGTLPSKTLRETALTLSGLKARNLYGVDLSIRRECTVQDFLFHEQQVVRTEQARVENNFLRHKVDTYHGTGSFLSPHQILVQGEKEYVLNAKRVLIATGSSPFHPDNIPWDHPAVYDSDSILKLKRMPKELTVLGGGVIGCEYACTFAALGSKVYLINGRDEILSFLDQDISRTLRESMVQLGITFITPERVDSVHPRDDDEVIINLQSGRTLRCDTFLVATGRVSNVGSLTLDNAGVKTGHRGLIEVNEHYQTSCEHIYAAGDVIGFPALASTSMEQARYAMDHAFDLGYKREVSPVPAYGIYTIPEVSMAGKTEKEVADSGIEYVVGKAFYNQNARGMIIGDQNGVLKLIYSKEGLNLLGVHVVGEMASEIIHAGLIALMSKANYELFINTCFNYPTLSELYKYATYDAMGKAKS